MAAKSPYVTTCNHIGEETQSSLGQRRVLACRRLAFLLFNSPQKSEE